MEQIKKIKVALICSFSTTQMRAQLPLDNRKLYGFARKVLGMPPKNKGYGDVAPWTSNLIESLSQRDDIDLHVISAHSGLKKMHHSFELHNVNYHFVKSDFTTMMKRLIKNDNLWRKLNPMSLIIKRIVNKISPDIVNLVGTENAFISSTILDVHNYPIYVLCQTIYNNPDRMKYEVVDSKNASTEMLIFQKENYFGVYSKMHHDLLLSHKPSAYVFDFKWPGRKLPEVNKIKNKKYDFVNFAQAFRHIKGFQDSIEALSIVKKKYPNVMLNLIGGDVSNMKQKLETLVESLGLKENVVFTPFFEKQADMFQHLQYSRFAVLPCKMDHIAGTMLQSMHYGLPLVVYETSGTPSLNKDKETVLISEHSNVESLAKNMLLLMDNPVKAEELRNNAFDYRSKTADNGENTKKMILDYHAIINHYNHKTIIPENLLFNLDE